MSDSCKLPRQRGSLGSFNNHHCTPSRESIRFKRWRQAGWWKFRGGGANEERRAGSNPRDPRQWEEVRASAAGRPLSSASGHTLRWGLRKYSSLFCSSLYTLSTSRSISFVVNKLPHHTATQLTCTPYCQVSSTARNNVPEQNPPPFPGGPAVFVKSPVPSWIDPLQLLIFTATARGCPVHLKKCISHSHAPISSPSPPTPTSHPGALKGKH